MTEHWIWVHWFTAIMVVLKIIINPIHFALYEEKEIPKRYWSWTEYFGALIIVILSAMFEIYILHVGGFW